MHLLGFVSSVKKTEPFAEARRQLFGNAGEGTARVFSTKSKAWSVLFKWKGIC